MSNGFFIGGFGNCGQSPIELVTVDNNGRVIINLPLDLYVDNDNNVFAGSEIKNASLIYENNNEIYARKVV